MVDIQSKEVIDKISDDLKIQPSMMIPRELAKAIQLVYNVNPQRLIKVNDTVASDAVTATIMVTDPNKDTYIVAVGMSVTKSVLSTSISSIIQAQLFGQGLKSILFLRYEPVTAGEHNAYIVFPFPIKVERATNITVTNSTVTPSIDTQGLVYFYETDPQ